MSISRSWTSVLIGSRSRTRIGDGWLASAYNITPAQFAASWRNVQGLLEGLERSPEEFSNGGHDVVPHRRSRAEDVLIDRLAPVVHRPVEQLRDRLAFGTADLVTDKLTAFRDPGVQRLFVWPVDDEISQLHSFSEQVMPALTT